MPKRCLFRTLLAKSSTIGTAIPTLLTFEGGGASSYILVRAYFQGLVLNPRGYFIEQYNSNLIVDQRIQLQAEESGLHGGVFFKEQPFEPALFAL